MSLLDGRIDCDVTEQIESGNEYYEALEQLNCPSILMGRVTMQMHYAQPEPFHTETREPIGRTMWHVAQPSDGYIIATDTTGMLRWPSNSFDNLPLLVITSEECPKTYHDALTEQGISWISCGKKGIDLPKAMELLNTQFGVERLAVTGGGHINGAFLKDGLLDEISMMWCPGIDGRSGMTAAFDGLDKDTAPNKLILVSVEKINETIWAKYKTT